jgi:hypothetical protein
MAGPPPQSAGPAADPDDLGPVSPPALLAAAALTYYTVFSIVPVLAVGLWVMRALIDDEPALAGLRGDLDRTLDGERDLLDERRPA